MSCSELLYKKKLICYFKMFTNITNYCDYVITIVSCKIICVLTCSNKIITITNFSNQGSILFLFFLFESRKSCYFVCFA